LSIDYGTAVQRVGGRAGHFMPISLVDSQFATLESPEGEPGVLVVDAAQPREAVLDEILGWIKQGTGLAISERENLSAQPVDSANKALIGATLTTAPIYSGRVAQGFDRITDWLMAALLAFMVVVVFSSVVLRVLFGTGWTGAREIARLACGWCVM